MLRCLAEQHHDDAITTEEPVVEDAVSGVPMARVACIHRRRDSLETPDKKKKDVHLANKAVLVHWPALLAVGQPRRLSPHLLDVLEHHVAVSVKGLDTRQQLAVVADRNQDLRVAAHRRLQDGERAGAELVLFELGDFVLAVCGR